MNTLQDAVSFGETDQCRALIALDPSCVNAEGWHGLTPLHGAATKGKLEVVTLLLESGAHVNAVNSFGASPALFACQAGNLLVLHELIQHGASVDITDNAGRGCVHYAARSGCVRTMHYLYSVANADVRQRDGRGQTALHIATEHGHTELIRYLLKDKRVDPLAQDENLSTAMHISAAKGNCGTSWLLASLSSENLLEAEDIHGRTPIDEAQCHHTPRHTWLARHMNYWKIRWKNTGKSPSYPLLTWISIATCPFFGIVAVIKSLDYFSGLIGCTVSFFIVAFVFLWAIRRHRLRHVSQAESPGYAGLFYGSIVHSLFCYYYYIVPRIGPDFFWTLLGAFMAPFAIYIVVVLRRDPGKVSVSKLNDLGWPMTILDVAQQKANIKDFCTRCEIVIPEWGKHCRLCNQCMLGLDHHCLYLMTCVARNNHRQFLFLIVMVIMAQSIFIRGALILLMTQLQLSSEGIMGVVYSEMWASVLLALNLLGVMWTIGLCLSQIKMISEKATTCFKSTGELRNSYRDFKQSSPYKTINWRTRCQNVTQFFLDSQMYYKSLQTLKDSQGNFSV